MSTGQRHGCNRILVIDRNLDYPTLARWPTYFVQPPPPDDFANLCLGFAQLFCELVFWGLRNYFANLRNYFANLWFGDRATRVKLVRDADRHVLRQIPLIGM